MPSTPPGTNPDPSPYFLYSDRLGFRRWEASDFPLAMDLWGDPDVTRLIGGPLTPAQVGERLTREITTMRTDAVQYWPIFLRATGEHVGCCGLRPYRPEDGILEVGAHLRKAFWGRGYASEATRAVMAYAFETLGVAALFAGHNPANAASRRVLEALGFRYTHDEYYPPTGLHHPSYLLTRAEFAARHRAGNPAPPVP